MRKINKKKSFAMRVEHDVAHGLHMKVIHRASRRRMRCMRTLHNLLRASEVMPTHLLVGCRQRVLRLAPNDPFQAKRFGVTNYATRFT